MAHGNTTGWRARADAPIIRVILTRVILPELCFGFCTFFVKNKFSTTTSAIEHLQQHWPAATEDAITEAQEAVFGALWDDRGSLADLRERARRLADAGPEAETCAPAPLPPCQPSPVSPHPT